MLKLKIVISSIVLFFFSSFSPLVYENHGKVAFHVSKHIQCKKQPNHKCVIRMNIGLLHGHIRLRTKKISQSNQFLQIVFLFAEPSLTTVLRVQIPLVTESLIIVSEEKCVRLAFSAPAF